MTTSGGLFSENHRDGFVPEKFDENGKPTLYRWDSLKYRESLSPAQRRNSDRRLLVVRLVSKLYRHIPWMNWPILRVAYTFWNSIFEEGIKETIIPRWGAMTFAYLNDGIKPTLWHTWRQITCSLRNDPYCGIYPGGAPKSLRQAKEWEEKWEAKRWKGYEEEEDDTVYG